jgi:MYXO-CTERM domain-containing protein
MLRTTLACLALTTSIASAEVIVKETVVHDTKRTVQIDLNAQNVLCSAADYGALFLKILIPELAGFTLLDHQNTGAGAPCVAAGPCQPGNQPADIIDTAKPTEIVDIHVKAIRVDELDTMAQTCETYLTETVDVTIRGKAFKHERFAQLGSRPVSDCGAQAASIPGGKADESQAAETQESGGCSTNGTAPSAFGMLALGALFAIRRRRR